MKIFLLLILSILSAICYRAGGLGVDSEEKYSKWIPKWMRTSIMRDMPCSMIMCLLHLPTGRTQAILWLVYFGLNCWFLSTYWDWLFKGKDTYWFSGLTIGLAGVCLLWLGVPIWYVALRTALLVLLWGTLGSAKNADLAEYSRGAALAI